MRQLPWLLACLLVLGSCSGRLAAKEKDSDEDLAALRKSVERYQQAYQKGDAKALAALWSDDAEYVSPTTGQRLQGRKAIEKEFARIFAAGPSQLDVTVRSLRLVTRDVAVEEGDARVTSPGEDPEQSTYVAIYVKHGGQWLLDSVRETEVPSVSGNYEHLKELEWMVGTWVDQDDDATVTTTCQWTKNKNFLTRTFKMQISGQSDLKGTQVIGWDASQGRIRSWVFDSDGGFSEGHWTRKGNRWVIHSQGTLADGGKASSMNILTYVDDDTLTWQSTGREVDGELLPNLPAVTVKRVSEDQ